MCAQQSNNLQHEANQSVVLRTAGMDMMLLSTLHLRNGATELLHLLAIRISQPLNGTCMREKSFISSRPPRANLRRRFIAAERPPHLKAIAPWEGIADYYRELLGRGGIPNYAFVDYRGSGYCGTAF